MDVSSGLIQFGLTLLGPWMTPFSLLLTGYTASMKVVCGSDPPPMPDFSNFNPVDLLGGVFNSRFEAARAQLAQAFQNWLWYRFCRCAAGALIQQPVTVVPPPLSTTVSTSANSTPCFGGGWTGLPDVKEVIGINPGEWPDITAQIVPVGAGRLLMNVGHGPFTGYEVPRGLSSIVGSGTSSILANNIYGPITGIEVFAYDQVGRQLAVFGFNSQGPLLEYRSSFVIDPTWVFWHGLAWNDHIFGDPTPTLPMRLSTQVFCGGSSPDTLSSCCPPDPAIANMLQSIQNSIANIPSGGGLPPGSYVDSVVHQGLRGLGSIAIQRQTVAVRVVITTDNNQLPVGVGDPPYLFDRGFIVPMVANGSVRGNVRLVYNPQLYVLPQLTEQIGYTLTDSLVVSLTELVPGP